MVHDHEETQPNARKRSYPFIQWVNPGSSPPRSKSPERQCEEEFHQSLPSPPLQSNKYKLFKQNLDTFGGGLKSQDTNGVDNKVKVEEKQRIRKTSWAEADRDIDRNHIKKPKHSTPSSGDSVTKLPKLKTDVHHKKTYSEISPNPEKKKKKERHLYKARENEMHVSSSGQDYDEDSLKSASFDEEEPPVAKRPKYSVEIREIAPGDEEEYKPNIAESIKLRKPSESRRQKSETYDESDARTIKRILSSSSILDDKKLSLSNNCKLANRISTSHPYIKKAPIPAMNGPKIKVVPRSSLLQSSLDPPLPESCQSAKVYVQTTQTNGGENGGTVHANRHTTNDRNHNKVKDNGYDSRKVAISNVAGEVKYKKASGVSTTNSQSAQSPAQPPAQPRPSSTVVSSSTEVNNDEETEEEDEHDGQEDAVKDTDGGEKGSRSVSGRVTLQPSANSSLNGFGIGGGGGLGAPTGGGPWYSSSSHGKERPTPYSRDGQTYKQVCRSRKFNTRYPAPEKPRQKRAVIQDMVRPLKQWLLRHRHNPYPTKGEKVQLAVGSNMTLVQVSNWFANARRRLKNVVQESRCSWSKRLRLYNQFVQGNAELLSISSDDSIWNSGDEDDGDKSDTGSRPEDFEDGTVVEPAQEHNYSSINRPQHGSDSEDRLQIDLEETNCAPSRREDSCTPPHEGSGSGPSSPGELISRGSTSPTDSDSPPCSPPENDNIPDTQKYKNRMLERYLNDAEEAQRHNNRKNSQTSNSQGTSNSSEDGDAYPDQSDLSVGHEVYPPPTSQEPSTTVGYETPPTLLENEQQWHPVDDTLIPAPSQNITISFTHLPLEKPFIPVLTQPPRDNMGVEKVKRQLDLTEGQNPFPSPPNQTVYVSLPSVPVPVQSQQFSSVPVYPVKSEEGRSNSSSPISSVSSPTKVFPNHNLRPPPFILPGTFPFYPQGPINGWAHFPVPYPLNFLHLTPPDSNCGEQAPPSGLTPPPWPGGGSTLPSTAGTLGSPTWASPSRSAAGSGAGSGCAGSTVQCGPTPARWGEMEAAVALSQLANCPVSGSIGGGGHHQAPSPSCT